jgi:multidrug efflux system outer membrane protein
MNDMTSTSIKRAAPLLSTLAFALVLAGCTNLPRIDDTTLPATPASFKEGDGRWAAAAPAEAQARGDWWKAFGDPVLDNLVERAGRENTSVQIAAARLAQARALLGATDANRLPQLGASAGAVRQSTPDTGGRPATLVSAGLNASYEVDVFGRLARDSSAASLDVRSRTALLQSARLIAQADVAQSYFALRALDVERAILRDTLVAYRGTLRLVERRFEFGDVAELDVARVRTELAATESDALALDARRATLEHAIAVLVGEAASRFAVEPIDWKAPLPQVPAGVPSTVLARRPDVAAAMASLKAAQARVGVAQTAWLPSVSLTAAGGGASPELSDVFKWSARTWAVGALLAVPVFDGGRRRAGIDAAQAEFDVGLASYRERVLVAFKEVEDELASLRLLAEQSQAQGRAIESASRATALSESRYRNGLVSQLDLLDAQRSELRSRRQAVQVQSAQYQATVGLIRALGGGWDTAAPGTEPAPASRVGYAARTGRQS